MPGSASRYTRPDAAKEYFSFEKVNRSGIDWGSDMVVTLTATDWGTIANPSYVDVDGAGTVVCSGLPHEFNGRVGVVTEDTLTTEDGVVACAGVFFMPIATGITPTQGEPAYWDVSAETFILTGAVTGDIQCGFFRGTEVTLGSGNSQHLPAGDYCLVELTPYQTVLP